MESSVFEQLDFKLAEEEKRFADLVDGTEKTVRWFENKRQKTEYALLYLHGFSASRQELSPTTERVADQISANAFYPRLRGHGRSDDAMAEASVNAWKQDALEALEIATAIGEKVILISASTGGTLGTWLLKQPASSVVVAHIMVSPNFGINSSAAKILTWPGGLTLGKWIGGDYNSFTPVSDKHAQFWTERYPLEAVVPMLELVDEVEDLQKHDISTQQLIVYSPQDKVVSVKDILRTAKEFPKNRLSLYEFNSSKDHVQHVLSGDACSAESTDDMVNLMVSYIQNGFKLGRL